jgi:hypothetical protein
MGCLMSGASILSSTAPFGVAWVASADSEYTFSSAVGAAVGYILILRGEGAVRYFAAVLMLLGLRWVSVLFPGRTCACCRRSSAACGVRHGHGRRGRRSQLCA